MLALLGMRSLRSPLVVLLFVACTPLPEISAPSPDAAAPSDGGLVADGGSGADAGRVEDGGSASDGGGAVKVISSCASLRGGADGIYALNDAAKTLVYCESAPSSANLDGMWTLVLKADGTSNSSSLGFSSPCWTGGQPCPPTAVITQADALAKTEALYAAYAVVPATEVRVKMVTPGATSEDSFAYSQVQRSLAAAIAAAEMPGAAVPSFAADTCKTTLLPGAALQASCARGLSLTQAGGHAQVRIGYLGSSDTSRPAATTSWLGVGGDSPGLVTCIGAEPPTVTTGNVFLAACGMSAPPPRAMAAFAYVYVR